MKMDRRGDRTLHRMYLRSVLYTFSGAFTAMLNTVIDGLFISRFLGTEGAASLGLVLPLFSLINLVPILLGASLRTQLGERLGRGDLRAANHCVFVLAAVGAATALPLSLALSAFRSGVLALLCAGISPSPATRSMAGAYLLAMAPAMLPLMLCPVLHPVMQLDGDAARSPRAIRAATAVNLLGDALNSLVFRGGMLGMGVATSLSCYTELGVLLLHFGKKRGILSPRYCRDLRHQGALLFSGGIPFMARELTAFLTGIALNRLVFRLGGESAVGVLGIGNSMWLLLLPASTAVCGTGATLGSVAKGEADPIGAETVRRLGIWYALIPCSGYAMLFFLAAGPLARFCQGDASSLLPYLRCLAAALPFTALCQACEAYFSVNGRGRLSLLVNVLDGGAILLGAVWLLGRDFGVLGVWAARPAGMLVLALGAWLAEKYASGDAAAADTGAIAASVRSEAEAAAFSEELRQYCLTRGLSPRTANSAALCAEELACNTLQWGYGKGRPGSADLRAAVRGRCLSLRLRDSARQFDPLRYVRQFRPTPQDPAKNVGLRIISAMASDMRYANIADCNIVMLTIDENCPEKAI